MTLAPGENGRDGDEARPEAMMSLVTIQAVTLLFNLTLNVFQTLAPLYLYHVGLSPASLGIMVAFPSLFQIFMRVPAGVAADRWGEKPVLALSSLSMLAASLLYLPGKLAPIVVAQALSGVSRTCFYPAAQSYLTKVPRLGLGRKLGLFNSMTGMGTVIGPVVAGLAIAGIGFRGAFVVFAISSAVCVVAVMAVPRIAAPGDKQPPESMLKGIAALARVRPVVLAGMGRYAAALPMALTGSFLPVYLRQVGIAPERIGVITGARGLFLMLAGLVFAWLYDRIGRSTAWLIGMLGAGLAVVLIPSFTGFWPLFICVAAIGFATSPLQIMSIAVVSEKTPPHQRAMGIALIGTLWGAALFVTPLLFGVVTELASVQVSFWVAGAPLLALGLCTRPLFRWAYGTEVAAPRPSACPRGTREAY